MSTEHDRTHLHAVGDDGNGFTDEPTNPGSHGAVSRELRLIRKAIQAQAQREIDRDDRLEQIELKLDNLGDTVRARIPPYALWVFLALMTAAVCMQAWSLFGGGA